MGISITEDGKVEKAEEPKRSQGAVQSTPDQLT